VDNPNLLTEAWRIIDGEIETIVDPHRGIVLSHHVTPRLFVTVMAAPCKKCGVYKQTSVGYSLS
jgi:hypothetical protein